MNTRLEEDVREALHAGTQHLPSLSDPYARVMATVDAHRRRRRAVVAGSAVTALAVAGVLGLASGVVGEPDTSIPVVEQRTGSNPSWGLPRGWPARGALGTDPGFVAELAERFPTDHLVFAEDGDAGRTAVAVSVGHESVVFHGARGAPVGELDRVVGAPAVGRGLTAAVPLAGRPDDGHLLVVLVPPHLTYAQLSLPSVARDGSVERSWRSFPVTDGVGRTIVSEPLAAVRIRTSVGDGPAHVVVGPTAPLGTLVCGRCDPEWFATEGLAAFRAQAAAAVAVAGEEVSGHVLVDTASPVGADPGSTDDDEPEAVPDRIVVLVATLPSGGLLRASYVTTAGPEGPTVTLVEPLRPLPAGDGSRPVVVRPASGEPSVLVAPGASRVGFTPLQDAEPLADAVVVDGVAPLTDPPREVSDYRLTAYASDGVVLRTWHGSALRSEDPLHLFARTWSRR
jgi:hypothetical protein